MTPPLYLGLDKQSPDYRLTRCCGTYDNKQGLIFAQSYGRLLSNSLAVAAECIASWITLMHMVAQATAGLLRACWAMLQRISSMTLALSQHASLWMPEQAPGASRRAFEPAQTTEVSSRDSIPAWL
jgi:hypothetical protein